MFRVGVTRDFLGPDGSITFGDIGLGAMDEAGLKWEFLSSGENPVTAEMIRGYDALLVLGPRITAETLQGSDRLAVLARFGVGYDTVDVEACTAAGVALTITPDGVRRPVAATVLTFVLALSHKLLIKDRLTREGRWGERLNHMGMGLTGRTLGVIGLGNIGREVFRLAAPFEMRHLAADPFVKASDMAGSGVELVDLDRLMSEADFVVVCCALTPETKHLVNGERLGRMKKSAYLINVARGPIVDQEAMIAALRGGKIAGAGLDVFEREPVEPDCELLRMENVIVAPHALCWTDECFAGIGKAAVRSILDVAEGRAPRNVVNRSVLETQGFKDKLAKFAAARGR